MSVDSIKIESRVKYTPQIAGSSLSVSYGRAIEIAVDRPNTVTRIFDAPSTPVAIDGEEGFTCAQFEKALKLASKPIAQRAKAAKAKGTIGKEATKKLMDAALDADA